MKAAIYSPYLDSFGGGERYILTAAETLVASHQVDILFDQHLLSLPIKPPDLIKKLAARFNLDLQKVNLVPAPVGKGSSFYKRLMFLKKYDLLICLTDGSIFYSTAKKNILHFQVPFLNPPKDLWSKIKLSSWDLGLCNSLFTRGYINKNWPLKTSVLYPPVETGDIKPLKKKKYILSVGRFTSFTKTKKHGEMIQAFKSLFNNKEAKEWSLHLAGSVEGDKSYIDELRNKSKGFPVFFYPDLEYKKLLELYGNSSIYWHAAGLRESDPAKMEHFGITTAEAMAGGCVPVVINKGGQPEIIGDSGGGLLWDNLQELQDQTLNIIRNPSLMEKISQKAVIRSSDFSKDKFVLKLNTILKELG